LNPLIAAIRGRDVILLGVIRAARVKAGEQRPKKDAKYRSHRIARNSPNGSKLSDRDPEARVGAKRREAKARHVPGFMAGAHAVTEPVELTAARR
jgi:hypothetical protein